MKSAMYVVEGRDLDFLKAYLSGLVLTLALWYVYKLMCYAVCLSLREKKYMYI